MNSHNTSLHAPQVKHKPYTETHKRDISLYDSYICLYSATIIATTTENMSLTFIVRERKDILLIASHKTTYSLPFSKIKLGKYFRLYTIEHYITPRRNLQHSILHEGYFCLEGRDAMQS
jgi:hypothetical protein